MPQPFGQLDPASHEVILGVPRSGKSYRARERVASARRVVFFDPAADYGDEGERVFPSDLLASPELLAGTVVRLVVEPDGDDLAGDFATVVAACRAAADAGGLVLVADEVGDYSMRAAEVLTRLHRNGHHDNVASILVSQCAVDVPKTCRRTATRVTSLLQTASADLDALETEYGPEFRERVARWRPGDPPAVWTLPTMQFPPPAERSRT